MKQETTSCSRGTYSLCAVALAAAISLCGLYRAFADTVTYVSGSGTTSGFRGGTWNPATLAPSAEGVDPSQHDYLVAINREFTTYNGEVINAHSLTIGTVGGTAGDYKIYYNATFQNDGLVLANGVMRRHNPNIISISGPVSVTSPSGAPFVIRDNGHRDCGIRLNGTLSGADTTGLRIALSSAGTYDFTLYLAGSANSYLGHIDIDGSNAIVANSSKHAGLTLENVSLGASVTVKNGGVFGVASGLGSSVKTLTFETGSTLNLSGPLTVSDLTLASGITISLKYDSSTATCATFLAVTNSLVRNGTGPITLSLSGTWPSLPPAEPIEVAVMSFPEGTELAAEDFTIGDYSPATAARTKAVITVQEDAETHAKRIVLGYYPRIAFSGWPSDSQSYTTDESSMMTNAAQWADGLVPHAKAHYSVDRYVNPDTGSRGSTFIRTPCYAVGAFEMPAESLYLNGNSHLVLMCRDFYLKRLDAVGGNTIYCSYLSDVTIHGDLNIGASTLGIQEVNSKLFTLDGNLYGSGTVSVYGRVKSSNDVRGYFHLAGTNSLFTGRVTASMSVDSGGAYPRWAGNRFTSLYVSDARNFGGPLDTFTYNALTLANMSELIASNSVAFTDTTRGLYLKWIAQFTTPSNTTLTLRQPVTFNASVYKNGVGTLEMGGELKFIDAEGALTDTPPEAATNRTLFVTGGLLKPIAARSLDGIDIVFSNKTSKLDVGLALDVEPSDLDLKTNGLYNVRTSAPIAKSPNINKVPVYLLSDVEEPGARYEVAVMTVKEEAADAAFGMIELVKPKSFDTYSLKMRRVSHPESETVTLVATLKPGSLFILLR